MGRPNKVSSFRFHENYVSCYEKEEESYVGDGYCPACKGNYTLLQQHGGTRIFFFSFAKITLHIMRERSGSNESWGKVPPAEMLSYRN